MLKDIADRLALTRAERRVILFLACFFVCGLGIRLIQKTVPSSQQFDYHAQDSTFAALSSMREDSVQRAEKAYGGEEDSVVLLNINTATREQLIDLPGIGTTLADRILEYRASRGPFRSADEMRRIKGMTQKRLEHIRPLITIR